MEQDERGLKVAGEGDLPLAGRTKRDPTDQTGFCEAISTLARHAPASLRLSSAFF